MSLDTVLLAIDTIKTEAWREEEELHLIAIDKLYSQMAAIASSKPPAKQVESILYSDNDVLGLGYVNLNSDLWWEIREIQYDIVMSFGK
jgi:hypothetical protein